jgi:hypothetical protein
LAAAPCDEGDVLAVIDAAIASRVAVEDSAAREEVLPALRRAGMWDAALRLAHHQQRRGGGSVRGGERREGGGRRARHARWKFWKDACDEARGEARRGRAAAEVRRTATHRIVDAALAGRPVGAGPDALDREAALVQTLRELRGRKEWAAARAVAEAAVARCGPETSPESRAFWQRQARLAGRRAGGADEPLGTGGPRRRGEAPEGAPEGARERFQALVQVNVDIDGAAKPLSRSLETAARRKPK